MSCPTLSPALPCAASVNVTSWKMKLWRLLHEKVALLSPVESRLLSAVAIMVFRRTQKFLLVR